MKVKEYGHIRPKEIKCWKCGAILEYTDGDIIGVAGKYRIVCPVCRHGISKDNDGNPFENPFRHK